MVIKVIMLKYLQPLKLIGMYGIKFKTTESRVIPVIKS